MLSSYPTFGFGVWLTKNATTQQFLRALVSSCSVPAKILASHLVKLKIEGSVEVSESKQDLRGDLGMGPAL